jgi:hypothetical protein
MNERERERENEIGSGKRARREKAALWIQGGFKHECCSHVWGSSKNVKKQQHWSTHELLAWMQTWLLLLNSLPGNSGQKGFHPSSSSEEADKKL